MSEAFARSARGARPVWFVSKESWADHAAALASPARAFAVGSGFTAAAGQIVVCPDSDGAPAVALMGLGGDDGRRKDPFLAGKLASALPAGVWSAPGRVNLIGEHTDYTGGLAMPFAINQRAWIAARPRTDGIVRAVAHGRGAASASLQSK